LNCGYITKADLIHPKILLSMLLLLTNYYYIFLLT